MAKKAKKAKKAPKARVSKKTTARKPVKGTAKKSVAKAPVKKAAAKKKVVAKSAARPRGSELTRITAGFTANDAEASIKWYCDVLGFTVIERWEHEGRFMGAQIGSGDVVINLGQDDWKQGRDRVKGVGARLYISMGPDVDGYAAAIKARGGTLAQEPITDWGVRAFGINDPDGYKLTFMHELSK